MELLRHARRAIELASGSDTVVTDRSAMLAWQIRTLVAAAAGLAVLAPVRLFLLAQGLDHVGLVDDAVFLTVVEGTLRATARRLG